MPDGMEYVLGAYGITALTLVVWFALLIGKLRRQSRTRLSAGTPPSSPESNGAERAGSAEAVHG